MAPKPRLTEIDLANAARRLNLGLPIVQAVCKVESNGTGFLDDGRPVILFERHIMYRQLRELGIDAPAWEAHSPDIVNRLAGGYKGGKKEHDRLNLAIAINRQAALASCSWGVFQIMGFHWRFLGYKSAEDFAFAMSASETAQLNAFVLFLQKHPGMIRALRDRNFSEFARLYNGPEYKRNLYDLKLARAYAQYEQAAAQ